MKPVRVLSVLVLAGVVAQAAAAGELGPRLYAAAAVDKPPRMDGVLDEECWRKAEGGSPFTLLYSATEQPREKTTFRAVHDAKNLYLAIECAERDMKNLVLLQTEHDGDVFMDDCVEVFIAPAEEIMTYYHFVANARGVRYDAREFDRQWSEDWEAAATRGKKGWKIELKIPFASLGAAPREGQAWRLNVDRERHAGGENENSTWSDTGEDDSKGFHSTSKFGYLVFGSYRAYFEDLLKRAGKKAKPVHDMLAEHPAATKPFRERAGAVISALDAAGARVKGDKPLSGEEARWLHMMVADGVRKLEQLEQEMGMAVLMGSPGDE